MIDVELEQISNLAQVHSHNYNNWLQDATCLNPLTPKEHKIRSTTVSHTFYLKRVAILQHKTVRNNMNGKRTGKPSQTK